MKPISTIRNAIRNAPWLVMAVALHAIVIAGLAIIFVSHNKAPKPETLIGVKISQPRHDDTPDAPPPPEELIRTKVPEQLTGELISFDEPVITKPAEPQIEDLRLEIGDPNALDSVTTGKPGGNGPIGVGGGSKKGNGPSITGGIGDGKLGPGRAPDEVKKTERAVLEGMRWLVRHQNPDGSWSATNLKDRCAADSRCGDPREEYHALYDEGVTALAVLCFLGAGHDHESELTIVDPVNAKRHRVGEVVKKGLLWLRNRQSEDGHFSREKAYMYNEALATMALAEAYGLSRNRTWRDAAQKGVAFLERAQRANPSGNGRWGWRYASRMDVEGLGRTGEAASKDTFDADTSITTWCVMALKSAQLAGLEVEQASLDGALEFVKFVTAEQGAVGYIDAKGAGATVTGKNDHFKYHPATMSALGMCSRIFITHDPDDPFLELAAKQITQDLPAISKDKLSVDYYYWYYASLALNQFDGPDSPRKSSRYWGPWNKAMVESLLALQNVEPRSCQRGGWTSKKFKK